MSNVPPYYALSTSFATIAQEPIVSRGLPGPELDAEFTRASDSINQTIARLSEIQRDDGKLKPEIVNLSALAPDVLSLMAASGVFTVKPWELLTDYKTGDIISDPTSRDSYIMTDPGGDIPAEYLGVYSRISPDVWTNGTHFFGQPFEGTPFWAIYSTGEVLRYFQLTASTKPELEDEWRDANTLAVTGLQVRLNEKPNFGTWLCIEDHTSGTDFETNIGKWVLIASSWPSSTLVTDNFIGTGAQTAFDLSTEPPSKAHTQVFVNGNYVTKDDYEVSDSILVFDAAPANGASIEVTSGTPARTVFSTVSDGAVTADKLASAAVTADKLADASVTAAKLAPGAIPSTTIADGAVTGAKIANFAITSEKITAGAVVAGKLGSNAVQTANISGQAVTGDKIANGAISGTKLAPGPLALQGDAIPSAPNHAAPKDYVDATAEIAKTEAIAAAGSAANNRVNRAGDSMTGSLTMAAPIIMGTAPISIPAGSAPILGARAWVNVDSATAADISGTYNRNGSGTITVAAVGHGLVTGNAVYLDFTTGGATDGVFTVTRVDDNTFTVPQAGAVANGAVALKLWTVTASGNVNRVSTFTIGSSRRDLLVNFASPMPDGNYVTIGATDAGTVLATGGTNQAGHAYVRASTVTPNTQQVAFFR